MKKNKLIAISLIALTGILNASITIELPNEKVTKVVEEIDVVKYTKDLGKIEVTKIKAEIKENVAIVETKVEEISIDTTPNTDSFISYKAFNEYKATEQKNKELAINTMKANFVAQKKATNEALNKVITILSAEKKALKYKIESNECDINKLKLAVAKLINKGQKNSKFKTANLFKDIKGDKSCTKTLVPDEKTLKAVKGSYVKFENQIEYTAAMDLYAFDIPAVSSPYSTNIAITSGQTFMADKWTHAGWIHAVGIGWVKGYKLSPAFTQIKVKKNASVKAPTYENVTKCDIKR